MIKSFFWNKEWRLFAWGGLLFLLLSLYLQVYLSVQINKWYGDFYNLLQIALNFASSNTSKDGISLLWSKLFIFFKIAVPYVVIATITNYFTKRYSLWWREAITFNYIPRWRNVKKEIEGASQRIQQDTERFSRIVEGLGLQIVRAIMTLIAFMPILWQYSKNVNVPDWFSKTQIKVINSLTENDIKILQKVIDNFDQIYINYFPGTLVWVALIASLGGLIISWYVGYFLPKLEYNNQVVEAAYRKELVHGEDDKINYASVETLTELFLGVKFNNKRLFLHYGYFDLWVILYDQCMMIVPYIIVGPGLFTGLLTLGMLVQISNAFQKVHNSFALFIHNWTTITELRSIWKRLHEFEDNLRKN